MKMGKYPTSFKIKKRYVELRTRSRAGDTRMDEEFTTDRDFRSGKKKNQQPRVQILKGRTLEYF